MYQARFGKYTKYASKYERNAEILRGRVCEIEEQNKRYGMNVKTAFYLESLKTGNKKRVVMWGRTIFNLGDILEVKGRFIKNELFVAWSHTRVEKAQEND